MKSGHGGSGEGEKRLGFLERNGCPIKEWGSMKRKEGYRVDSRVDGYKGRCVRLLVTKGLSQ